MILRTSLRRKHDSLRIELGFKKIAFVQIIYTLVTSLTIDDTYLINDYSYPILYLGFRLDPS